MVKKLATLKVGMGEGHMKRWRREGRGCAPLIPMPLVEHELVIKGKFEKKKNIQ